MKFRIDITHLEMHSAAEAVPFEGERQIELRRCEMPIRALPAEGPG